MKYFRKIDARLAGLEKILAVVLFLLLAFGIVINIISRNLLHVSLDCVLEFSPALVLWLALIGSSLALKEQRHIKIEIFMKIAPPRLRAAARVITSVFGMGVMGILAVAAMEFVRNEIGLFGAKGWPSVIFPVFFTAAFLRFFIQLGDAAKDMEDPK